MVYIALKTRQDHRILFAGYYDSVAACLEDAVCKKIRLDHVDLRGQLLINANLDDAIMPHADLSGANLSGANLSEAQLQHAVFENSMLYNTCLSYSNLSHAHFSYTQFGGTLIDGSVIKNCIFAGQSFFTLAFQTSHTFKSNIYHDQCGERHSMNSTPIVINGILETPIMICDEVLHINGQTIHKSALSTYPALVQYCVKMAHHTHENAA